MKLEAALDEFLTVRSAGLSPRTLRWYSEMLECLVRLDRDITYFTPSVLAKIMAEQRLRPRQDMRPGTLAPSTIGSQIRAIKVFFRWAFRQGYLPQNPAAELTPPRSHRLPKSLSRSDLDRLLDRVHRGQWPTAARDYALLCWLADTGCRLNETVQLQIGDIDFETQTARVIGKGDKERLVGFGPVTLAALRAYLKERTMGPVWLTFKGQRLRYWGVHHAIRWISIRTGIPFGPHRLRHTFGTLWIEEGGEVAHLQTLMGHADAKTTLGYVEMARAKSALAQHRRFSPLAKRQDQQ